MVRIGLVCPHEALGQLRTGLHPPSGPQVAVTRLFLHVFEEVAVLARLKNAVIPVTRDGIALYMAPFASESRSRIISSVWYRYGRDERPNTAV